MYCSRCGAANPDGAKFCRACGARMLEPDTLLRPESVPAASRPPAQGGDEAPSGGSRTKAKVKACVALAIIVALVGVAFICSDLMERQGAAGESGSTVGAGSSGGWAAPSYLDPTVYDGTVGQIVSRLEADSFYDPGVYTDDSRVEIRLRALPTDGAFPGVSDYVYVSIYVGLPDGWASMTNEEILAASSSSTPSTVHIYAGSDLSEDDLAPMARTVVNGLGLGEPDFCQATSEELLYGVGAEFGLAVDPSEDVMDDGTTMVSVTGRSDRLFSTVAELGIWTVHCRAGRASASGLIQVDYMPVY